MEFLDNLKQFLSQHLSSRVTQLIFDPIFLAGGAALVIIIIVLLML